MKEKEKKIIKILKDGGVGVIPTDTLYGLVGSAFSKEAINRIYKIKKRDRKKALLVLISNLNDLKKFGIVLPPLRGSDIFNKFWPGKVSIILPCSNKKFKYIHQGLNSIAFRLPAKKSLIELLKKTGPLVAPSANPEGEKPAENIKEAKNYFADTVDFYLSGGTLKGKPSQLIKINNNGEIETLR
jgi:L-threonylcarbamoyladenylate synthase